ncbi:unnamed protein product [marine sediment metagenome]|uniref:Uncharacterized protein n=1 Tax=marine sediment metagenome TaxID=412755 RepID=X1NKA9_9ZZZZ
MEVYPRSFQMSEDFGEYRVKSSLGHYGTRTDASAPLLEAIQSSEEARHVFESVRKNIIGLFNRLWELKLATTSDLNPSLRKTTREAEAIHEELAGMKILKAEEYLRLLGEVEGLTEAVVDLQRHNAKLKRELNMLIEETA